MVVNVVLTYAFLIWYFFILIIVLYTENCYKNFKILREKSA